MRRSSLLKTTAQDACIFCAFRSAFTARSSLPRRRHLQSAAVLRRQQTGFAFADDDDFDIGGFAKKEPSPAPPPPPPDRKSTESNIAGGGQNKAYEYSRRTDRPLVRYGNGTRAKDTPAPLHARNSDISAQEHYARSTEASISPDLTLRWSIGRRKQPHAAGSRPSNTPFASHTSEPSSRFERPARNQNFRSKQYTPWQKSDATKTTYTSFDPRSQEKERLPKRNPQEQSGGLSIRRVSGLFPTQSQTASTVDRESSTAVAVDQQSPYALPRSRQSRPESAHWEEQVKLQTPRESSKASSVQHDDYFGSQSSISVQSPPRSQTFAGREARPDARTSRSRRDRATDADFRRFDKKPKTRNTYRGRELDDDDQDFDVEAYHDKKKQRQTDRATEAKQEAARKKLEIKLPDFISVGSLATELGMRYSRFAKIMAKFGYEEVNHDFILGADDAALIVEEAGFIPITENTGPDPDLYAAPVPEDMSSFPPRPPVVTIMGHVDHGKTTLLDYMRKSAIVASEHGGITQHIGAFSVPMPSGKTITFLDTPGHAAFLSMRQRGANVTDIVILVVAADDSVMPQTLEALKHAKSANVPIIVAMNKIDKPEAKPDQVKTDLARHGVDIEDYGGDVQVVPVSGKTGEGMSDLEDAIIALSEIQDRRAPADGLVEGWVLESSTKEVGKVATVLIRRGTLRPGDIVLAGTEFCRVRIMRDEHGNPLTEVKPGMPAEIVGWRGQPTAGDEVLQAKDEQQAHSVISLRETKLTRLGLGKDIQAINETRRQNQQRQEREKALEKAKEQGLELPAEPADGETATSGTKFVYLIVKGDVSGSVEAVVNSIAGLGNNAVRPHVLRSAVGPVTEFDVDHATASGGYVVNFNMAVPSAMQAMAERAGTRILDNNVIYRLMNDVKSCLEDVLEPVKKSRVVAEAEILQSFEINTKGRKFKKIAGCKIRNGIVKKANKVRVVRGSDMEVVFDGSLVSLKNVKKDVEEMAKGTECGMGFEEWEEFQVGDLVQTYEEWEEKSKL